jgi:hypothetical protein
VSLDVAWQRPTQVPSATHNTPRRFTTNMAILAVLVLLFGVSATIGATSRQSLIASVRASSGPLAVQAEILYRCMSDADATAATAFLSTGSEPQALRDRYEQDIATATAALVNASAGGTADAAALRKIAAGLPVYTGLVETARADNRLGLPLGAAYLREASALMRSTLLKAASALYDSEITALTSDRSGAEQFPWFAFPLGIIVLVMAVRFQFDLARRTQRILNPALVAATLAVVVALGWLTISWSAADSHLNASNTNGSSQVEAFTQARIAALRARADEALTLVARGADPSLETDYVASTKQIAAKDGLLAPAESGPFRSIAQGGLKDLAAWEATHKQLRDDDNSGDYPAAVDLAIGVNNDNAPALAGDVDADFGRGIDQANQVFTQESGAAAGDAASAGIAAGTLAALAVLGVVVGFRRRIAEYR